MIRVGDPGGVLAFGLGEMLEQNVESVLEGGAGHRERLSLWQAADIGWRARVEFRIITRRLNGSEFCCGYPPPFSG